MKNHFSLLAAATVGIALLTPAHAEQVLNLYSARHYQTDEALYANFTKQTGIKINRIEAKEDELLERIKNEGANSPADVFITVDAARLAKADELGLFAAGEVEHCWKRASPRTCAPTDWFAFSTRARVIIYNKETVKPSRRAELRGSWPIPTLKGQVCSRSGSHPYNLSLLASLIAHHGEAKAEDWARGVVANFARTPKGGDTDQIRAVAAGECGVAISNSYYLVRLLRSDKPEDRKAMEHDRHRLAQPEAPRHAHQHLRRRHAEDRAAQGSGGEVPRIPGLATRRRATSPTATTSGRRSASSVQARQAIQGAAGIRCGARSRHDRAAGPDHATLAEDTPSRRRASKG